MLSSDSGTSINSDDFLVSASAKSELINKSSRKYVMTKVAEVADGFGGFLTERRHFHFVKKALSSFKKGTFFYKKGHFYQFENYWRGI